MTASNVIELPITSEVSAAKVFQCASLPKAAVRISEHLFRAAEQADESCTIAPGTRTALRDAGLLTAPFPISLGGQDLCEPARHRELSDVIRTIGGADLSIARLYEGHVNAVALICRYGAPRQQEALALAVSNGAISAVWGAEDKIGLRAVKSGNDFLLEGRKIFASGAGFVTRPLVTASSSQGQVLCLLHLNPGERADISGWTAQGMRSTATGTMELSGLELAGDAVIGKPGDFTRQPWFSGGAWRFCAAHVGATERLVDLFRDHLVTHGRSEDSYQLQRLAQCIAAAKTARFWVEEAARRLSCEKGEPSSVVAFANLTRMVTERSALDVMEIVQRGAGLNAFLRPHPIERICRDLATYLRQPVPDMAMSNAAQSFIASRTAAENF